VKVGFALLLVLSALLGYVASHGGRMPPHKHIQHQIAGWKWPGHAPKGHKQAGFSWGDGPSAVQFDNGG
jgi:hypothetical protein